MCCDARDALADRRERELINMLETDGEIVAVVRRLSHDWANAKTSSDESISSTERFMSY